MLSPVEEYAIPGGLHGVPQVEGYGAVGLEHLTAKRGARSVTL
jgi:hypothetical protein